ncbi:hypothetical protein FS749_008369 [Ceratobasidium sp. UAMH 11750]|nr:hypothetical protein FS749_008369 [Ceratobasidium sp. UAMH 11750]
MPAPSLLDLANKILGSFANCRFQDPHKIGFPEGWRKGDTEAWYKSLPTTKFTHLQYRKEHEGPFYHEYIVVELDNNTVCRFDRRGDVTTRANLFFTSKGGTAEDTAHVIYKREMHYADINNHSDMVLRIYFPGGQDLLTILGICYGVQKDHETRAFTLTRYNAYFLSWMIITATARRTVDWALLGKDTNKWEELVRTTIEGLTSDTPSLSSRINDGAGTILGLGRKNGSAPSPDLFEPYLIDTLRKALFNTRSHIQQSLDQLIFQTTVEDSVRQISDEFAKKAAFEACRNYASQVALDATMGAAIESLWTTVLYTDNGREAWRNRCLTMEELIHRAAEAAAEAGNLDEVEAKKAGPQKWEVAWDNAWSNSWGEMSQGRSRTSDSVSAEDRESVSERAKEAWLNAWIDACGASEKYVPLLSDGVTKYVTENLPDSLPDVLKIDLPQSKMQALFSAMGSEMKNSELQVFIQGQIADLCARARAMGYNRNPAEIEEAMRRVWVETIKVLDDDQN